MHDLNLLIVEDTILTADNIYNTLIDLGAKDIRIAGGFADALQQIKTRRPDLILLDINLGESKNGIDLAETLNASAPIPFIYITGTPLDGTLDRAIRTHPLGYLIKPFRRDDLKSTLMLALYKMGHTPIKHSEDVDIGRGYAYDRGKRHLFYNNKRIKLSPKERALLELLIASKGHPVSHNAIEVYIWEGHPVSLATLRTLVWRLRAKLETEMIETLEGVGWRLKPVEEL